MTKRVLPKPKSDNVQVNAYVQAVRSGLKAQHVVLSNGGWAVKRVKAERASRVFATQKEAMTYATRVAKNNKTEVFLHDRDGRIRERSSFGSDPYPPRG